MAENETHSSRPVSPGEIARSFRPLKVAWADTTSRPRSLMLTVLGGLADFERDLIRARTGEGRKRAQERRQVRLAAEAHPTSTAGGSCSAMPVPFRGRTSPFRLLYRKATVPRSFFQCGQFWPFQSVFHL